MSALRRGLGQHGDLAGGVGVERAGGGGFGGVVDGEAGPQAVGLVAQVERVADQRKGEERDGAEREDGGDGVGGVFVVGVDGRLGGDDGRDSADGRADGQQRGELGLEVEGAAEQVHEGEREREREGDKQQRDAAEMEHVAEQEAGAEQDDAGLEPELIGGHAGLKDARDAGGVGDEQADDDGPEHVFDIGKDDVVGLGVEGDGLLNELAGVAHDGEQQQAGDERKCAACEPGGWRGSDGGCGGSHENLLELAAWIGPAREKTTLSG